MRSDFIELARICIAHSRVTASQRSRPNLGKVRKSIEKRQRI